MPTLVLNGTELTFEILQPKLKFEGERGRLKIAVKNPYLDYSDVNRTVILEDLEEWIFAMRRLLAGAYAKVYSLSFDKAGVAVDLYPYMSAGKETSRTERRENDCVMALRLLMRSEDKKTFLGGVYTLLLHRKDIEIFSDGLRKELDESYPKFVHGKGEVVFVGVSPLGYKGCSYWYLDETGTKNAKIALKKGDFVWVRMGKHQTEQIVYVDQVRFFPKEFTPYDPDTVKRVIRVATENEVAAVNPSVAIE